MSKKIEEIAKIAKIAKKRESDTTDPNFLMNMGVLCALQYASIGWSLTF